jgi:hypothetical protein
MMYAMPLFLAVLFVVLTPGVVLSLPPKSSLLVKAIVHAIVFAVVYYLLQTTVAKYEGFGAAKDAKCAKDADCASGKCANNMCA